MFLLADTRRWPNVGLLLARRLRRRPNSEPTSVDVSCLLGAVPIIPSLLHTQKVVCHRDNKCYVTSGGIITVYDSSIYNINIISRGAYHGQWKTWHEFTIFQGVFVYVVFGTAVCDYLCPADRWLTFGPIWIGPFCQCCFSVLCVKIVSVGYGTQKMKDNKAGCCPSHWVINCPPASTLSSFVYVDCAFTAGYHLAVCRWVLLLMVSLWCHAEQIGSADGAIWSQW